MAYTPPAYNNIDFVIGTYYEPPDHGGVDVILCGGLVVYVLVNGDFKAAVPSILVSGEWKSIVGAYVLVNGSWRNSVQ